MAVNGQQSQEDAFPCKITLNVPFPDQRLSNTALRALSVDEELSPLVRRSVSLTSPHTSSNSAISTGDKSNTILTVHYSATTNRMLRVATNGFFESVGVVLSTMRELDVDVVGEPWMGEGLDDEQLEGTMVETQKEVKELKRVQGLMEAGPLT